MAASFSCEACRVLFASPIRVIHDIQITTPNGDIVSKHQRWDEEWREVGRSHGWELAACSVAATPLGYQVRASSRGRGEAHTTKPIRVAV